MSSFPEEPLDLLVSEGGGYYAPSILQKLNNDKYEIIRKLGHGSRSTVWLVIDHSRRKLLRSEDLLRSCLRAAKTVELPIMKAVRKLAPFIDLPVIHGSFWEDSSAGAHLCFAMNELGTTMKSMQGDAVRGSGPSAALWVHSKVYMILGSCMELRSSSIIAYRNTVVSDTQLPQLSRQIMYF